MKTKFKTSAQLITIFAALLLILAALNLSCSSKPSQNSDRVATKFNISIPKSSLIDQIDAINLQIIVDDSIEDTRQTQLVNGKFDFGTISIPTGEVTFALTATQGGLADDPLRVLYAATTTRMIEAGDAVTVDVELLPAIPMVKLAPYHDQATVETVYTTTLELWNLSNFNNGRFSIKFDPNKFSFDGAVQANSLWGTLNILASFNSGEVTLIISRPSGLENIVGSHELALIRFNALSTGTANLDLTVQALQNNSGIVPEYLSGALYTDDATIDIGQNTNIGTLHGVVRSATDNSPVANAIVSISGPVSNETTTDAQGNYQFLNLPFGSYQLTVSADGFIQRTGTVAVNATDVLSNVSLSTALGAGQFRIVLTWGALPEDLDAHFYTLVDNIVYEVYFGNVGAQDQLPYAVLDVDDVDGFGPETITVYDQVAPITFAVHNFSQFSDPQATPFSGSQAHVDLYQGDQLIGSFDASSTATQEWWNVFNIDANGTVMTVNTYSDSPPVFAFAKRFEQPEWLKK